MIKQKICNAYNWIKQKTIKFKKWFIAFIFGTAVLASGYGLEKIDLGVGKDPEIAKQVIEQKFLANENIKERYDFDNGKLITKIEHIDDIKIAVGEVDFKPNMEISRWNGEIKMKVKPRLNSKSKKKELVLEDKKIKYKEDKKEYHLYEVKKGDETYNGATSTMDAYEVEVILLEKPDSNIVEMDIETQGLAYYYQPALDIEMAGHECWTESCTEADCCGSHRPENIVGSYAVYHESKQGDYTALGGKNYKTGKAFHIYRPKIIDSAGTEVWGKLNIDVENKLLTVTIPQEFLDNAVYPVMVDPTFGSLSAGTSNRIITAIQLAFDNATGAVGTGDSISAYLIADASGAGSNAQFYLYDASLNKVTNGITNEETNVTTSKALYTLNFTNSPTLTNQTYHLAAWSSASGGPGGNVRIYYDTGGDNSWTDSGLSYNTWPNTLTKDDTDTGHTLSIYCTYTAGGGAARRIIITQ